MGKKIGAEYHGKGKCSFTVWAPEAESVEVVLKKSSEKIQLSQDKQGYWQTTADNIPPESLYKFRLDQKEEFPDPASLAQPEGVHSWSQIIDHSVYSWSDSDWKGRDINEMIIYELHVGTFTEEGTFKAIIERLDHLEELGINTIEIMPIAQFPGERNWGYDGVYPFAAQESYGGVEGLKKLVDECHRRDFSVLLDVVYNHFGPEGNYISQFGPYFTDKYHTPWGSAINFDDEYSNQVRNHFVQNALMWLEDFHFDGLRLDAVHEIIDRGARHFLKELSEETDALEKKTGRKYVLIAESDLNDSRLVADYKKGGYGLEGQWVDDFHHSLHAILTAEDAGYFLDFGKMDFLAKAFRQGFVYDGIYSEFRKKNVGNSPAELTKSQFVVCIQNHDQVGNRLLGERLSQLVSFEKQKLAAATLLISPYTPMLFMGEEFGEDQPFQYFVSHGDPDLVKAVQEGRKREFEYFLNSSGEFPDPQSEETFQKSKLNWNFKEKDQKNITFEWYKHLLKLRKQGKFDLFRTSEIKTESHEDKMLLKVSAEGKEEELTGIFNFSSEDHHLEFLEGRKRDIIIASAEEMWGGKHKKEDFFREGTLIVPAESMLLYSVGNR